MASGIRLAALVATLALAQHSLAYVPISKGCYTSSGNMVLAKTDPFQTYDTCEATCVGLNKPVFGVQYTDCWCGSLLPSTSDIASAATCNKGCPGYGQDPCGSLSGAWTVYLTGIDPDVGTVGSADGGSSGGSSSSAGMSMASVSIVTQPTTIVKHGQQPHKVKTVLHTIGVGSTIVKTIANPSATGSSQSNKNDDSGSGTNTIAIAVGVVVGIVLLAVLIAGVVLFMKKRRKNQDRAAHRRTSSINSFIGNPTGNSSFKSRSEVSDNRLDPGIMVERRQSAGSVFADNQDYSRRILTVTNPDR